MSEQTLSLQQIADISTSAMWENDNASRSAGIEIVEVTPGESRAQITVEKNMVNGHDMCHGGYIFLLADTAFAFACNSHGPRAVAQHCAISFIKPAYLGQKLTAYAKERLGYGRSGIYDITVQNEHNEVIAEFRGHSRTIGGAWTDNE